MKPTEILKEEHRAIESMLDILERVSQKLSGGDVPQEHLEKILEFIKTFADRCHHGKEEDLLFPAMEEAGIPKEGGPIGVMLQEHEQGRAFVRGMREACVRYKAGDREAASTFAQNATGYIELLREHIEKEDQILFPMAEAHLSEEKEKILLEAFERVEEEKMGRGVHEEMHMILRDLDRIYPGE